MTEYLLYVSLVFIPIAGWIAYLLHQDGFDITTIILVLIPSYLMITAFPFSIQYLGTGKTILAYGAVFVLLIMVMCKPELFNLTGQGGKWVPELAGKSLTVPGGETPVFSIIPASDRIQPGDAQPAIEVDQLSSIQETLSLPKEALAEGVLNPAADLPDENVQSIHAPSLSYSENVVLYDRKMDSEFEPVIPAEKKHDADSGKSLISQSEPADEAPAMKESQPDSNKEINDVDQDNQLTAAGDSSAALAESAIIDNNSEDLGEGAIPVNQQQTGAAEIYSADGPAEVDYCYEAQDNLNQDESQADAAAPQDGCEIDDHTQLADWIEMGFAAKGQEDFDRAAVCFTRALQVSTDDELKYLLGMELVSVLQNIGNYEQAEIILDDLLQTISAQPAMIMELRQQKQYVSLLGDELNRLGLAGTPIFEVPRFVRMKVNDKMLA